MSCSLRLWCVSTCGFPCSDTPILRLVNFSNLRLGITWEWIWVGAILVEFEEETVFHARFVMLTAWRQAGWETLNRMNECKQSTGPRQQWLWKWQPCLLAQISLFHHQTYKAFCGGLVTSRVWDGAGDDIPETPGGLGNLSWFLEGTSMPGHCHLLSGSCLAET